MTERDYLPFTNHIQWYERRTNIPFNRVRNLPCLETWNSWHDQPPVSIIDGRIVLKTLNASDGEWGCGFNSKTNNSTPMTNDGKPLAVGKWSCISELSSCFPTDVVVWNCISGKCRDNHFEYMLLTNHRIVESGTYVHTKLVHSYVNENTNLEGNHFFNVGWSSMSNPIFEKGCPTLIFSGEC